MAIDSLALGAVAVSPAAAFAAALRGRLVASASVAIAIPIGMIPPAIPIAALAAAIALASGTVGIARVARMFAPAFASLSLFSPCRPRRGGDAGFGRWHRIRGGGLRLARQDSLDARPEAALCGRGGRSRGGRSGRGRCGGCCDRG
jgi:hypothetical protein